MASLIRSAKSGSDWTTNELLAFNISIEDVDINTFFGIDQLPDVAISPIVLENDRKPEGPISKDERLFFYYLQKATIGEEATVDDFTLHLLKMLDFDDENRAIVMRKELAFDMCGSKVYAKPDLCVMSDREFVLMVQEDKRAQERIHPAPQLIAEAIASFVSNNQGARKRDFITFPAVTMVGAVPLFYKIPISNALVEAVSTAQYPTQHTAVQRLFPPVPNIDLYLDQGLNALENRTIVMKCFEALKGLL